VIILVIFSLEKGTAVRFKIFLIFLISAVFANAKVVEVLHLGKTYPFAEEDFLVALHKYIQTHKKEIDKKLQKIRKEAKQKIIKFKPQGINPLTPATKNRTFYPDLTYTLPYDIKDAQGNIIYPKGFKFNPANYVRLPYTIVVINGERKEELKWAEKNGYFNNIHYRIFLTDGNWYEIMKKYKTQVYYCMPQIEKRFKLKHTPSIITQIGNKIEVKEICLECKDDKKNNLNSKINTKEKEKN